MNKGILYGLVILVAAAIGVGGWFAYSNSRIGAAPEPAAATATSAATGADTATAADAAVDGPVPVVAADEMALGKADAPVTIVEYFSLGCPHCKHFHEEILPQLKSEYIDTGKVRIVFRDFPLDGVALAAAQLTRCVSPMAYFPMVDALFQKQTDWHRVTAWGRLAEVVNQYMGKGKRVRVIGRLEYQTWNDKTTGESRSRAVIVASQVLFLDYDRAYTGLAEEPEAEQSAIEQVVQPEAEQPAKPKRSRHKQAA